MGYARESADDEQYTVIVSTVGPGGDMPWSEPRVEAEYAMQANGLTTLAEVQLFIDRIAQVWRRGDRGQRPPGAYRP